MKRKAKSRGSGGRLRLTLLLATAAAFLLVPASQAFAAINAHVTIAGTGAGEVIGVPEQPGTPPIACKYVSPGPPTGVCDTEAESEGGAIGISLKEIPAPGSKFKEWIIEKGSIAPGGGCKTSEECTLFSFGSELKVKAIFEKEPNVHVIIEGSGSGKVYGDPFLPGNPAVNCNYVSPGPATGACDVEAQEKFGVTGVKLLYEAAPGSKFAGWTLVEGISPGACETMEESCTALLEESTSQVIVKAKFDLVPKFKLNLSTSGSGSGSFKCNTGGGPVACQSEYLEGTNVKVTAVPGEGSEFVNFTGDCSGSSCEVTMNAAHNVGAVFNLASVPFSVTQIGEGSVKCEDNGGGLGACAASYTYGHTIKVVATPETKWTLKSLTGTGSAAGNCNALTGTCSFVITAGSSVTATFVSANIVDIDEENVHGEVPETTELASSCGGDVNLGEFKPGVTHNYTGTCVLTVTSTGEKTSLTASDNSGVDSGYLTQKPLHPYSLPKLLKTQVTGTEGLGGEIKGIGTLETPFVLLTYPKPVSADHATLEFNQPIGEHDSLHTGVYAKMVTLTLEQTTP